MIVRLSLISAWAVSCSSMAIAGGGECEVVTAGAGSWLRGLPEGVAGPPRKIYAEPALAGRPMPTNDWWSSLAWVPLSDSMFPHPLAVRAVEGGLKVWYPGAAIVASDAAIMGGGGSDVTLGHSAVEKFAEARVAGWSDWFVTARMGTEKQGMNLTFGHGSPFVYAEYTGGEPTVTLAAGAVVFAGSADDATLGVRIGRSVYGFFAPGGSRWEGIGTQRLTARTSGKLWFSLALLPNDDSETLKAFAACAHAHVTDSVVSWKCEGGRVDTAFRLTTVAREGANRDTLFALYPHQVRSARTELTKWTYQSVRGPMKVARGLEVTTTMTTPAVLPSVPLTDSARAAVKPLLQADMAGTPQLHGDTYWIGKQLGKWATLRPLAEQAGNAAAEQECVRRMKTVLENFLTAGTPGRPDKPSAGLFAWDPLWGALIGYPASYGSDDQLNDHHFHYGYLLRAAGELARRDPAWAQAWKPMLDLLIRDIAGAGRQDAMFPFLRCFDPYAGHSWASGHAKFGDGNNNESSSEAVNAWFGMMLLGEATGDVALRDLAQWLFTTEIAAIEDYWFDVRDDLHPTAYKPSVVTMVWGGKGANGTWFSASPESIHGINFLPVTGASLYLGRWPEYAAKNYDALVAEKAVELKKRKGSNGSGAPDAFEQWADVLWMYRAFSDPADARRLWSARPAGFKPEAGNSLTQTEAWIAAFEAFGQVDSSVTADIPFHAVFVKDGRRTHVAWNVSDSARTVTFSDGTKVNCPPRELVVKTGG